MGSGGEKTSLAVEAKHWVTNAYALTRYGRPGAVVHFGGSPGDSLLCTTVTHELRRRGEKKIWLMSNQPELFHGNPDIDAVVPYNPRWLRSVEALGGRSIYPEYARYLPEQDRSTSPPEHILAVMCRVAGITGDVALRPYLNLTPAEREAGQMAPRQMCVQSSVLNARMPIRNKEWFPERMQQVVDALKNEVTFIQLGAASDPPLQGATDFRGKTTLREAAAILSRSIGFIGMVGFLMHLARAVECRSVIVFGGREAPAQSGYSANINLYSPVPCSPCWLWSRCDYGRMCLDAIGATHVIDAARQLINRPATPLEVDHATL